jgi:hypothetical protein
MLAAVLISGLALAVTAQDTATPAVPVFATNTPRPELMLPDAAIDRYALRLWDEPALVNVLVEQINRLRPDDKERQLAVRLLQKELQQRFPGSPRKPELRDQLLRAMLNAPPGSVDMRPVMRTYIQTVLNQLKPSFAASGTLNQNGFSFAIAPAKLDRVLTSAVIHTRFPAVVTDSSEVRYEDYIVAQIDGRGVYRILDAAPVFPAAPLGDVTALALQRLGDVNQDGLDEVALAVTHRDDVNQTLTIYGLRNNRMVDLTQPGQTIQFAQIPDWPESGTQLTVRVYRVESPAWNCLGERDLVWTWSNNFFRPPASLPNYTFQSRLACLLFGSEPFFEGDIDEAITKIQSIIPFAQAEDLDSVQRANIVIAMLEYLKGDTDLAVSQVEQLQPLASPGSWLSQQTAAFLAATSQPGVKPVQVCAALVAASRYGACNVDEVLAHLFKAQPLQRDTPLETQFENLGLKVLNKTTITTVNRVDRQAFLFDLSGVSWWAFAGLSPLKYTAEKITIPPGIEPTAPPAPVTIMPPDAAYTALLDNSSAAIALNVVDNAVRENPGVPLAPSARYLQALSYDLLADRANARKAYFALWTAAPSSLWGQIAAQHLERR